MKRTLKSRILLMLASICIAGSALAADTCPSIGPNRRELSGIQATSPHIIGYDKVTCYYGMNSPFHWYVYNIDITKLYGDWKQGSREFPYRSIWICSNLAACSFVKK
jgi:hypothetical protein